MIFVINDGGYLSLKMDFVVQNYKLNSNEEFFYIFRKADSRFEEKWSNSQVNLATSISGNFMHFLLMLFKSPKDFHDGLLRRLLQKRSNVLLVEGFLSVLSQALGNYFEKPPRTNLLMLFLRKANLPKIFLIDESVSIRIVDLKLLKLLGSIVYVSQDIAYDRYNFGNNVVTKALMYKLEHDVINLADLVIACSERDQFKYLEMGAKKVVFYPNIYPLFEFEASEKSILPSVSIILRGHWGPKVEKSLEEALKAISLVNEKIKVYLVGIKPQNVPKNVTVKHYECIPVKLDYFKLLSRSWIGINIGVHRGGTNQRKYDYALAGLVVLSDNLGARGDLLPHEYVYIDTEDLAAKLKQLLKFGRLSLIEMGIRNRKETESLVEKQCAELSKVLKSSVD